MENYSNIEEKYPDFDLFWMERLQLFHALDGENKEHMLNPEGDIIYSLPAKDSSETYWTNLTHSSWDKQETDFNRQLAYWIEAKLSYAVPKPQQAYSIYSYKNNRLVRLLDNALILKAAPVSPQKIVVQLATDKDRPLEGTTIGLYDASTNEYKELLSTNYHENPFDIHPVFGQTAMVSVLTQIEERSGREQFWLYKDNGERLLDFEITIGQGSESTYFEPTKKGMGITYKMLETPIKLLSGFYHATYQVCNVLVDTEGNCYGDFYDIAGRVPSSVGKSATRYPKYFDKKILCLSLPEDEKQPPYLVIVNEDGSKTVTSYECPWIFFNMSAALVKDKAMFGRTAIVVLDKDNLVRLIDLNGNEIENTYPIKFENLMVNYAKQF